MKNIFEPNETLNEDFKIKFFVGGDAACQRYRVVGKDENHYFLKLYNSSQLSRFSFSENELVEAEILSKLDAGGINKLVGNGEIVKDNHKYHYLVIDYISGESLKDKLEREGVFSQYSAVPIVIKILEALETLHSHPQVIVHNNINIDTISLDYSTDIKSPVITGFEHARYISSPTNSVDVLKLSPFYVAPELLNGVFTPQSDVFSVGALIYHLIMGVPPWYVEVPKSQRTQENYIELLSDARVSPLNFGTKETGELDDEQLRETIKKALSPDIENRFKNTEEFIGALKRETELIHQDFPEQRSQKAEIKPGEGFSAIAGMQELKDLLYSNVIRALDEKELYEKYGLTIPNGMLLYGPPGCGKTFIAERFAEEVGFNMLQLKPSDIKSKWVNATEEKIGEIFKQAYENAPTIIFIDEFDAIVPNRENDIHQSHASAVNEILAQMSNCSEKGIFVIAASNRPEKIDPAVLRTGRIDKIIYLPPPDSEARASMIELYLKNRPTEIGIDYQKLAELTENYVASDIKFLVDEASRRALELEQRITQEIFERVISDIQPSVSYKELQKYQSLKENFENKAKSEEPQKGKIGFT